MRSRPWSKLQKEIDSILDQNIDLQFHCTVYRKKGGWNSGMNMFPKYWFVLNREIIWNYPDDFTDILNHDTGNDEPFSIYPDYGNTKTNIPHLICEYLNTPRNELLTKNFQYDIWGLTNLLLAADRRIGKRRFRQLCQKTASAAVDKVLGARENASQKGE
ncbi:SF0329 family protein [Caproiciproducens faecalis]|uniref:Uncharacterized protein n=1 Tax=Caproiciproducens faecalis TaxID=2820301 RepID=A0ABS7DKX0_9FIRM|nr:hypothetical protein [Caproiciproducens faecalis]MBW7571942.1 hypothetical protein [Caproiciproducens faecalis]